MSCCGAGFSAGKFIAAIVAVGLGGFAAFNYATSGSLCGSCKDTKETAAVQPVGAESADACPMGACSDKAAEVAHAGAAACTGEKSGCSGESACDEEKACPMTGEAVQEVAATTTKVGQCGKVCGGEGCDPASGSNCGGCDKDSCDKPAEEVATTEGEGSNG
ncbi:MAG: hypothetical protein DYG94_03705 [Leptolyngbya sp. PLA3]|nr:MAG: hypothetical protein EDM82_08835 [Cyanobacteria bacterium CYA]MCE7967834.1 hypothetical protein [Leptolyngbya sp. PL-A3]